MANSLLEVGIRGGKFPLTLRYDAIYFLESS
jgi:hypothetical protein